MELLEGPAPDGSPVRVDLSQGRQVLYFMTSSCHPCLAVWPRLARGDLVVTPSPSTESRRKVASLAPAGVTVIMSSDAWFAFRPGPAPWRVVLVSGTPVESGPAQEPPQEPATEKREKRRRFARYRSGRRGAPE